MEILLSSAWCGSRGTKMTVDLTSAVYSCMNLGRLIKLDVFQLFIFLMAIISFPTYEKKTVSDDFF